MRCSRAAYRWVLGCVALLGLGLAGNVAQGAKVPGLGDPGKLIRVEIQQPEKIVLHGKDARMQLVVLGHYNSGQQRDLTRKVSYHVSPQGVVQVDSTGFVTPVGNGTATVVARSPQGLEGRIQIQVDHFESPVPINFPNQIVPIFTKLGCNMGACHGKSTGQNGFKLSLLGFYPEDDYDYLVKEGRGRRLFPAAPDRSLLLLKATNRMAHGGGLRMEPDSYEYALLRSWIAQGMPYGSQDDPVVERIEVFPQRLALPLGGQQQLQVVAYYSDGSVQDVTRMAQFESNQAEMAEVSRTGLVRVFDLTGEVGVMVRYQGHVTVFRAVIPLGIQVTQLPPERNFIDRLVFAKLKELGIPPSPLCDDYTFIRRATLDICGRLPTPEEVKAFVADKNPNKRDKLIDRLLDSPDYADYFANKWASILRVRSTGRGTERGAYLFHAWIRQSMAENKPYDQFVREIVAASGDMRSHPPVVWYRELKTPESIIEDVTQLFLGQRIQCARCHHHPFERWSQRDYYSFVAFFTRMRRKNDADGTSSQIQPRVYHVRGTATAVNPRTRERLKPAGLGGPALDIPPEEDPRHHLVDWMVDPKNPYFAKSLVNRYWKHFFGRGIIDPEDDMRVTNPPSNPELLEALAQHFIKSGYDLKDLVRTICRSSVYQLDSEPNQYNEADKQNFSRYYAKRLPAEVLYDALSQATGVPSRLPRTPPEMRAVQLPDMSLANYFLLAFGRPQGTSPCECERSYDANLAQTLHLLNSREIQDKVQRGHAARLAHEKDRSPQEKVEELYLYTLGRPPRPNELKLCLAHIEKHKDNPQVAYSDILWALINTKEFLFNH